LLGLGLGLLAGFKLSAQSLLPADAGATVKGFQDNFSGSPLGANGVMHGDSVYSVSGGLLHVTQAGGDPKHLLYEFPGYDNTGQEMLARIRVLDFGSGYQCRGGLAVGVNSVTCLGVNYLLRSAGTDNDQPTDQLAFLAEGVAPMKPTCSKLKGINE
jgi:hypothetical protein